MEVSRAGALWVRTMRKIKVIFTLGEFMLASRAAEQLSLERGLCL